MSANSENKQPRAVAAANRRAARLAKALIAAGEAFEALAELPPGPERTELLRALHLLSAAAVPWMRTGTNKKRRSRQSPGVLDGWVGG